MQCSQSVARWIDEAETEIEFYRAALAQEGQVAVFRGTLLNGGERSAYEARLDELDSIEEGTLAASVGPYKNMKRIQIQPRALFDAFIVPDYNCDDHSLLPRALPGRALPRLG